VRVDVAHVDSSSTSAFTVLQFRVVAATPSRFSKYAFESFDLPYPFGKFR
jgi:hypothetical protein